MPSSLARAAPTALLRRTAFEKARAALLFARGMLRA